jgi:hypothetical protein
VNKSLVAYADELSFIEQLMEASVDPETGEVKDFDPALYIDLMDGAVAKATSLSKVVLMAKGQEEVLKQEIDRLTRIKRASGNIQERLKTYALYCMQVMGVKSLGEKPYSLNRQRNSQASVNVPEDLDLSTWEEKFITRTVVPNKRAILEAWKAGENFPANVEINEGEHVRIR